ncbi:ABC transporter permease [Sciscionella marina]|uniref:ABC transporter permease n=1 Tax=Sciscionella marina TaxID=508770 RepID=UPI00035DB3A9|nr:ABC transporter permease [Sciscionella marina]
MSTSAFDTTATGSERGGGQGTAIRARVTRGLAGAGEIVSFTLQAVGSVGQTWRYVTETLRQAGILILSSGVVIWFMQITIWAVVSINDHYLTTQFGVRSYIGSVNTLVGLRGTAPEMWGWILAAKVGCSIVAELGSMRINEEVDAMHVMGVPPRPYLVGTRLVAAWIAMPFIYLVGLGLGYLSGWLFVVMVMQTDSSGGYGHTFWAFQSPLDLLFSLIWAMTLGTVIILVSCYYGYTAKGGPVGVGRNTAKSMIVNMVLISVIGMAFEQLFWGGFPNSPIAN